MNKDDDKYSAQETKHRFEAALRGARIAGHKPKEIVTQKEPKAQRGRPPKKTGR
jgi:hypothetical protein